MLQGRPLQELVNPAWGALKSSAKGKINESQPNPCLLRRSAGSLAKNASKSLLSAILIRVRLLPRRVFLFKGSVCETFAAVQRRGSVLA